MALIADDTVEAIVRLPLTRAAVEHGLNLTLVRFRRECERSEVRRLAEFCRGTDVVVGAGGGRAVDAAKLVGAELGIPVVTCPTLASTDAPVSRVAVLNRPNGAVEEVRLLERSPALVLVDSDVIAQAPVRYLVAGMGDALATWFGARACWRAGGRTLFGHAPTSAGLALAERCWTNLRTYAREALVQARAGTVGEALEAVIETNILLSGLGFENGGLALAHAVHNGLTQIPARRPVLHGERVAFGLLVQCVLEEADETEEVLNLLIDLGLPATLEKLGLDRDEAEIELAVDYIFSREKAKLANEPIEVTPLRLLAAILRSDELGRASGRRG